MNITRNRWVIYLCLAILVRCITFGSPVVHVDESFYLVVSRLWIDGSIPFVDVWDRKPIGLFILYLPAASLGMHWGLWAYQIMALAFAVATAEMIARLAMRAGWIRGAFPAGLAYLLWLDLLEGQGGQAPVFYNLFVIVAAAMLAPRADDANAPGRRLSAGAGAMLLIGLALQIKYSVVFEGLFLGLWWMWRERRLGRAWPSLAAGAALLATIAGMPTLIAWAYYIHIGHGPEFAFANFQSILLRRGDPWSEQLGNLLYIVAMLAPFVAAAVWGFRQPGGNEAQRLLRHWLFAWLCVTLIGILAFGTWFNHYALPALPPLCLCAAGIADQQRLARKVMVPFLALSLIAGQIMLVVKLLKRGSVAEYAALAKVVGHGEGCFYIYSGEAIFYAYSNRCRVTRYLFPSHLGRTREEGSIGVDQMQEIRRVFSQHPQIVMMAQPYFGERADIRQEAVRQLGLGYRRKASLMLGTRAVEVFEWRGGIGSNVVAPAR
jgi:hypothetical protein